MIDLKQLIGKNINQAQDLLDQFDWVINIPRVINKSEIIIYTQYKLLYSCTGKKYKLYDLS